jgi:hypothetical protein
LQVAGQAGHHEKVDIEVDIDCPGEEQALANLNVRRREAFEKIVNLCQKPWP